MKICGIQLKYELKNKCSNESFYDLKIDVKIYFNCLFYLLCFFVRELSTIEVEVQVLIGFEISGKVDLNLLPVDDFVTFN